MFCCSLALVDNDTLVIGSMDQIQMLHIDLIPLGESPRLIDIVERFKFTGNSTVLSLPADVCHMMKHVSRSWWVVTGWTLSMKMALHLIDRGD